MNWAGAIATFRIGVQAKFKKATVIELSRGSKLFNAARSHLHTRIFAQASGSTI
jgi:hypothetical protein